MTPTLQIDSIAYEAMKAGIDVNSSHIRAVGYDPLTLNLKITFKNGQVYEYSGISPAKYAALMSADSIGSYFHSHIK